MAVLARKLMDAPAATGISFVGAKMAQRAGGTSGNVTLAINSGLTGGIASAAASGDFVVAVYAVGSNADRTLSITDGTTDYTLIGSELYANGSIDTNLRVAYKFITSDTDVTFGPTGASSNEGVIGAYVFRGVNTSNPLDVTETTATGTGSMKANPPSITPSTAGSYIMLVGASTYDTRAEYTDPGDMAYFIQMQGATDTYIAQAFMAHKDDWTSGAYDHAAINLTDADWASATWAAISIALRP